MNPTKMKPEERPTPEMDAVIASDSGGGDFIKALADKGKQLERERDEAREQCKYWKGVVRGARAELSAMERITMEEYAALCADTECRDYVDQMDALKNQRDRLLAALLGVLEDWEGGYRPEECGTTMAIAREAIAEVKGAK